MFSEYKHDFTRVRRAHDQLLNAVETEIAKGSTQHTSAALALRILMFRSNSAGFIKQRSSVAMAMVIGIATKLNTDWFLRRRR